MGSRMWQGVVLALLSMLFASPAYPGLPESAPLPTNTDFDYQLGGVRKVPSRVGIVIRDRKASPARHRYNVCYVNGFQTQPDERRFWRKYPKVVLRRNGEPVVDESWGEWLLDIRTEHKRRKLARIVGRWINRCAEDGFDAVEFDNLDSFQRSKGLIETSDTKRYAAKLVRRAHRAGLAAAQKNYAEFDGTRIAFDFVIAEECVRWHECGAYVDSYGARVLLVEYRRKAFRRACRNWGEEIGIVRRDLALSKDGLRRWC